MPKPPMRLALLGHSEVEPTCYPHFLYSPFGLRGREGEQSRVDLVQNQLIFSLYYSTPLHSPSFPPPSKQPIKYHTFPFHHFSPSTTINNFQVHHPFMYTTSTKNSLHLSSSLFHLSLGSKTLCYKKNPSNLFASTSLPKSLVYAPYPFH